jgi:hypothetical protein
MRYKLLFCDYGEACNNQLTEELNDLIRSHKVLFSNDMFHLRNCQIHGLEGGRGGLHKVSNFYSSSEGKNQANNISKAKR